MKKHILSLFVALISLCSFGQSKGYEFTVDATGALGLSNLSKYNIGISLINGYRFSDMLSMGLGIGFRYAETLYYYSNDERLGDYESRDNKYLVPIFAHLKYNFSDGVISPFIIGDVGYTFDIGYNKNKNLEALFVEPIIGIDFKSANSIYYLGIGANVQQHHYSHFRISNTSMSADRTIKGVVPTIALHFGIQL
ncbi:MAG: hypothetical protein IK009_08050 [Bacteroidales bacterium]|nr:hypothetical protein [Bacteroidales bacterium]